MSFLFINGLHHESFQLAFHLVRICDKFRLYFGFQAVDNLHSRLKPYVTCYQNLFQIIEQTFVDSRSSHYGIADFFGQPSEKSFFFSYTHIFIPRIITLKF